MESKAEFFDFVLFILTEGDDAAVRAFDRALDQIRAPAAESSNASLQYNREFDSASVV
ncbi:MAG: hypothetical protein MIN69_15140 [Methylorubrum extorquens]|jgi:hypothetical protein|uniref:hypothetical protein n=1 Tax=Methylorubrum extorquens TaxID=408 RepID=UPI002FEE2498